MIKQITLFTLILVMVIGCAIPFAASNNEGETIPKVRANGYLVEFPDAEPYIDKNDRTLIPVRFATEAIGADVSWDTSTDTAIIEKNGITVKVPIGSEDIYVTEAGKTKTVTMDTKAVLSKDRTYVPIRFVAESLGAWVGFSDRHCTVQIYQDVLTPEEIDRLHGYYDMGYAEFIKARGDYEEMLALGYVVENDPVLRERYGGEFGMSNANEEVFYNASSSIIETKDDRQMFFAYSTNRCYYPNVNTHEEYAHAFVQDSKAVIDNLVWGNGQATVSFKTDPSCIYHSKCQNSILVRGICTIAFDDDYVMSDVMEANIKVGGFPFTPEAGKTYTFDAEWAPCYAGRQLYAPRIINLETHTVVRDYD